MEISTIASFKTVQNKNNSSQPAGLRTNQSNYRFNQPNNSPNFGKFLLDDLFYLGRRKLNNHREKIRLEQIAEVRKQVVDDTQILAKRLGITKETAAERYQEDLNLGGIKPKFNGDEIGLNKVVGYSLEKLEMIKKAVVPIIKSQEVKKLGKELSPDVIVPNGIILYGPPGTGKNHMAEALIEHLRIKSKEKDLNINTVIIDSPWRKGDTRDNLASIWHPFEKAQKVGRLAKETETWELNNEHTMILINNLDDILKGADTELLQTEIAFQTQHPAKDGVTWIATTNDKKNIPDWMLDKNRTTILMPLGSMKSDAEVSAVLSHFIGKVDRKDSMDHDIIIDYAKSKNIPMVPGKIKEIVDTIDKNLHTKKDYWTDGGIYRAPIKNKIMKETINTIHEELNKNKNENKSLYNPFDDDIFINK